MKSDMLTIKDQELVNEFKNNYMYYRVNLIAANIASIYKVYGNDYNISLDVLYNISEDTFNLNQEELSSIDKCVDELLRDKYKVETSFTDKSRKLEIEEID